MKVTQVFLAMTTLLETWIASVLLAGRLTVVITRHLFQLVNVLLLEVGILMILFALLD